MFYMQERLINSIQQDRLRDAQARRTVTQARFSGGAGRPTTGQRLASIIGLDVRTDDAQSDRLDATNTGTRVTSLLAGWEARGDDAQTIRDNYESGWDHVLASFATMAVDREYQ